MEGSGALVEVEALLQNDAFHGRGPLRNQLDRATLSISNNIAEGFERGTTRELITFLYYARGSAGEVRSMLTIMQRIPGFDGLKSQISNLRSRAESIARQLRAWADHLQNTDIEGQRYLNDSTRGRYEQQARARAFDERLKDMIAEDKRRREHFGGDISPS